MVPDQKKQAGIAGIFYLTFIVFSILADQYANFAQGTTSQVMDKILSNPHLFTFGLVCNILSGLLFFLAAWALYILLKDINSDFALLFLLLNLAGVVIQCISVGFLFASRTLLVQVVDPGLFNMEQLQSLSELFANMYSNGFLSSQVFFGLWLLPLGILIFKSELFPRFLGILLIVDCVAILLWFFQYFLFPQAVMVVNICLLISLIAELTLTFWLLMRGLITPKARRK